MYILAKWTWATLRHFVPPTWNKFVVNLLHKDYILKFILPFNIIITNCNLLNSYICHAEEQKHISASDQQTNHQENPIQGFMVLLKAIFLSFFL
jgi:hypothetical protein